jgi:sugar/nucleoside kinase (ribokinase family)
MFVVLGGTSMDVYLESLPRLPSGSAGIDEFTASSLVHVDAPPVFVLGGNGGNVAAALARLGSSVRLVSTWGRDLPGEHVEAWLEEAGCEAVNLELAASTGFNVTATADDRGRSTLFHGPAFPEGCAADLAAAAACAPDDILLLTGYPHPAMADLVAVTGSARAAGARVALDIGPATAGISYRALEPLLPVLDLLLCNERELAQLDPERAPEEILERLALRLPWGVVVKRGRRGASFRSAHVAADVPATPVTVRTTVGAGDVFNAGFLHAWATGADPPRALRFGCAAAEAMLSRGGGPLATPHASDLEATLLQHERTVT